MHAVVAGASGFLGTHLVREWRAGGHDVTTLVRRTPQSATEVEWDPYAGPLDPGVLNGADVVVNLAGAPTAGNPHSKTWARNLMESRVTTTRVLATAIAGCSRPPVFLAGNGISFYGDHGDEPLTESADSRGQALLTRVTRAWQVATLPAQEAGARVCVLRTAPVQDAANPPLKQLAIPFRFGLGFRFGKGRQYAPIISRHDWVHAVDFLATHRVSGAVNLCCPVTPTNAEYADAIASALGRKARLAVPSFVLRMAAGAMGPEILGSVRAVPRALLDAGFTFRDPDATAVIAAALA